MSLPSRVTRQIIRLEKQKLVTRGAADDGRGVVASITSQGRDVLSSAQLTYGAAVREHFVDRLSRPQVAAMGRTAAGSAPRCSRGGIGEGGPRLD